MNIPDEAVETAANAISESSGMRFDGFWSRVEDLEPEDREYALKEARSALEAAVPYIAAKAWDEGRKHGARYPYGERGLATDDNPYRSQP